MNYEWKTIRYLNDVVAEVNHIQVTFLVVHAEYGTVS